MGNVEHCWETREVDVEFDSFAKTYKETNGEKLANCPK